MNFLEIAKSVNLSAGLQGDINSVTNNTGIQKTLVDTINKAYSEIQLLREDWAFRRIDGTFSWNVGSTIYTNSNISKYTLIYYEHKELKYIEYEEWLLSENYKTSSVLYPWCFTLNPETNGIIINDVDGPYTINYRGIRATHILSANSDIPLIPENFHTIIVYKAAMNLGLHLGNSEIFNKNANAYDILIGALMRSQLLPKRIRQRPIV